MRSCLNGKAVHVLAEGKLNLDIQLKAPFRTHLDVYENGTLKERYGALDFDWNRLARLLYGDGLAG